VTIIIILVAAVVVAAIFLELGGKDIGGLL